MPAGWQSVARSARADRIIVVHDLLKNSITGTGIWTGETQEGEAHGESTRERPRVPVISGDERPLLSVGEGRANSAYRSG